MDRIAKLGYLAGATRFRRISERLHADGDKIYKDFGIEFKASWFSVFYVLATSEAPKTVLELSEEIGFTHITVKNVVRELAAEGLVKVKAHPHDGRAKHISLSAKGQLLYRRLQKIWLPFSMALKNLMEAGHPDFLNMINRIDRESIKSPINEIVKRIENVVQVKVLDYKPSLKKYFYELAGNWLLGVLKGTLEEEDKFTLHNPDKAYLEKGGFVFFCYL